MQQRWSFTGNQGGGRRATARSAAARGAAERAVRLPRAAPLGSTVSVDELELPEGFVLPKMSSKEGKVLHPDMVSGAGGRPISWQRATPQDAGSLPAPEHCPPPLVTPHTATLVLLATPSQLVPPRARPTP